MILAALNQYYDRLIDNPDPDTGKSKVPVYGYSDEKISYVLVISTDGNIVDVMPNIETTSNKSQPKYMSVPAPFKRPGKYTEKTFDAGKDNAFFLWDKTSYSLGVDVNKDRKLERSWVESSITFKSFKRFHLKYLANIQDEGMQAFLLFLQKWNPSRFDKDLCKPEILGTNIAFQLDGDSRSYLHDRVVAKEIWAKILQESNQSIEGNCLVSGKLEKIARLHPSIKGVYGGQSAGGSIVSFNAESYESYGKTQGENAPVSEIAAFKYTTSLNYLLNRNNRHCLSVGDASTVFWAIADDGHQAKKAEQLFMEAVSPTDDSEAAQLKPLVEQIAKGRPLHEVVPDIDPSTRFYLLGLAPNASRLSIRYWLDTSFGQLGQRISEHYTDLSLDPLPWRQPPSIWRLLIELVPYRAGQKAKSDEIPSHLAGELMRSILTGERYPHSLLAQLVIRIRADGNISPLRVAMIKAVLHRDCRKRKRKEEIPMGLDEENNDKAYLLGRLFAVLERIQRIALEKQGSKSEEAKKINATISDRYFGAASTVPYSVFPRLLAGSRHHLAKIRKDQKQSKRAFYLDEDIKKIISKLPSDFPKHFSIEDQGKFSIGYYHQRNISRPSAIEDGEDAESGNEAASEVN